MKTLTEIKNDISKIQNSCNAQHRKIKDVLLSLVEQLAWQEETKKLDEELTSLKNIAPKTQTTSAKKLSPALEAILKKDKTK